MEMPPERRIGDWIDGRLEIKEIIGAGSYAVVYLAECQVTHKKYGIKCLHKAFRDKAQLALQREEIEINKILRRGGHTNVVHMVKGIETEACFFIIMEYCDQPDMFDLIKRDNGFDSLVIKDIFPQLIDAVEFCHANGVYHRDLKPENVLVSGTRSIKLTDFGLATTTAHPSDFGCGSLPYMAPEVLIGSTATSYAAAPADMWALGVILFNMVYAQSIWRVADEKQDASFAAFRQDALNLQQSFFMSEPFFHLLLRVFHPVPAERCGFAELRRLFARIDHFCLGPNEGPRVPAAPQLRTAALYRGGASSSQPPEAYAADSPVTDAVTTTWTVHEPTDVHSPESLASMESLHEADPIGHHAKQHDHAHTTDRGKEERKTSLSKHPSSLMNYLLHRPLCWADAEHSFDMTSSTLPRDASLVHPSASCLNLTNAPQATPRTDTKV